MTVSNCIKNKTLFLSFLERFLCKVFFLFVLLYNPIVLLASESVDIHRLAQAIFYAEGGLNTRHPYGILKTYKNTSPKQACINTIKHALRDYKGQGDFIAFLAKRYAPINSDTDVGTNKYWEKNVRRLYEKQSRDGSNTKRN